MQEVGLRRLVLERGLLSPEELARLPGSDADVVLAGHLVALSRIRPEEIPPLLEAARVSPPPPPPPPPPPEVAGLASTVAEPGVLPIPPPAPPPPPAVSPEAWEPGKQVGRYQVEEEIGRGAMGVVYRVRSEGRRYALKLLLGGGDASPMRRRRFEEELRMLVRLDHPGLIRIRDGGLAGGVHPYFVMDLLEGRDLRAVLRERGRLAPEEAARVVAALARAVGYAHARGVLHRDIKPENVRIDAELRPTLFDFGLAKDLDHEGGLTRTGVAIGTPFYMSPEQASGRVHDVDERTDVWALGVLLFELLTGAPPFGGANAEELTRHIAFAPPPPLEVPAGLEAVVLSALEKAPVDRWQRAEDLAQGLEAWLASGDRAPRRRASPLPFLLGGAALSLLLALVALLARPSSEEPPPPPRGTAPVASAAEPPPAPAPVGIDAARGLAADARLAEALAALGSPEEASFLRAERAELLRRDLPGADGLRLLLCAEAGADRAAAERAAALIQGAGAKGSPALQEGQARAALLLHDPAGAAAAASAALVASPGDPAALVVAARARAAELGPEALRLDLARLEERPDAAGEAALAGAWSEVARALGRARAAEREPSRERAARLWTAAAWARAAELRGQGEEAARAAALEELAPLLQRVPAARIRAARLALVPAGRGPAGPLEEAEAELADAAATVTREELTAVLLAARLGGSDAADHAAVWLGVAGDLPARALLAAASAERSQDPQRRARLVRHALRLGPALPPVRLAALRLAPERELGRGQRDARTLRELVAILDGAPELWWPALLPLAVAPLEPQELQAALDALAGSERELLLARALARLHARAADPVHQAEEALAEARAAARLEPTSPLAHLLVAEALRRSSADSARVLAALDLAEAAAPGAAEPARLRLLAVPAATLAAADLEPLLIRGHVSRIRSILAHGREAEVAPPAGLVAAFRAGDGRVLDPAIGRDSVSLGLNLRRDLHLHRLYAALRLEAMQRPRAPLERASPSPVVGLEWLLESLERLDPACPERWAGVALGRLTLGGRREHGERAAAAALRALHAAAPGLSWPVPSPDHLRGLAAPVRGSPHPGEAELLPDLPALRRTWFHTLRSPALIRALLVECREAIRPLQLAPVELRDPWSRARALLEAVQEHEASARGATALLLGGAWAEGHLGLVRAAGFSSANDSADAFADRIDDLAEDLLWRRAFPWPGSEATTTELATLEGLTREALVRFGDQPEARAVIQATRVDLLLGLAGLTSGAREREELLRSAREALPEIDPVALGADEEPATWTHWRRVRVHGALGEAAEYERALTDLRAAIAARPPFGWRRLAPARDKLAPGLSELPGYRELLRSLGD